MESEGQSQDLPSPTVTTQKMRGSPKISPLLQWPHRKWGAVPRSPLSYSDHMENEGQSQDLPSPTVTTWKMRGSPKISPLLQWPHGKRMAVPRSPLSYSDHMESEWQSLDLPSPTVTTWKANGSPKISPLLQWPVESERQSQDLPPPPPSLSLSLLRWPHEKRGAILFARSSPQMSCSGGEHLTTRLSRWSQSERKEKRKHKQSEAAKKTLCIDKDRNHASPHICQP